MDSITVDWVRQGAFWEKLLEGNDVKERKQVSEQGKSIAMWNRRAKSFARNTANTQNEARREVVFQFLKECGVELKDATILDLGCGPGNYTLPMAREGGQVVALDPAVFMLDILREKADQERLTNISYSNEPWEEVDLDRLNWRGKFDLVFASMSPGVRDVATLKKMIAASRGYCYLSKFAGDRNNNLQNKIWPRFFKESRINNSADLLLPWNLLYAWGYYPNTRFMNTHWVNEEPIAEMEDRMVDWFSSYEGLPANYRQIIRGVLEEEAVNGLVREEVHTNIGLMVWQV